MIEPASAIPLPTAGQVRQAIEIYLALACPGPWPERVSERVPAEPLDPGEYLMSDAVERVDQDAAGQPRMFAIRLGNSVYPHMKLRIARPSQTEGWVFAVDCHDAMLQSPDGPADEAALEQLKEHNAQLAKAIEAAWDAADLPTQKGLLRRKIRQAKSGD